MYNINDKSAAIRQIQRCLAKIYADSLSVNENGIFDEKTVLALSRFQKDNGLEIKDSVDFVTFLAIMDAYNKANLVSETKRQNPHIKFPLARGMQGGEIYKVNSMLSGILQHYSISNKPPLSNYYSEETENVAKIVSGIFDMPEQHEIDETFYYKLEKELNAINTIISERNEYFPE